MKNLRAALAALILLAGLGFGQFPTTVATNADLIVARNGATTTLNGAINSSVTTFVLTSGTLFGNDMTYTIDSEHIFCATLTTNTTSVCTRGYNSSTAASHSSGATVSGFLLAAHHNTLATAIQATQGWLRDGKFNYCSSVTGNDSYACNLVPPITSYTTGARYLVLVGTANTGGATLALNGLSAITILKQHDQALATGDIEAGSLIEVGYDGTNMQMLSQLSSASGGGDANAVEAPLFCSDAGANDTYACSLSPAISTYATGNHYRFVANTANTGAASINLNALGAKTIVKVAGGITTVLADNDIRVGQWVDLVYDGTNMQLQSLLGNAPTGTPGGVSGNVQANIAGSFAAATASTMSTPHYCQDAGSTDAYACSVSPAIGLYTTGNHFWFKANTANTGTASINFNAIGARTIVKVAGGITTVLATNDIRAGQWVEVVDDGTNMQMQSTLGNAPAAAAGFFSLSTAVTSAHSATPTFDLADVSAKSPTRFEPGAMTANVTSVTFTNKTAGAKFSIAWLQDGTGTRTVAYGASASNTCTVSPTASKTTTQNFEVAADGTTVLGVGCTSDDAADTPFTSNTSTSVDNEVVLFSSTTGKIGKRATTTGLPLLTAGVQSAFPVTDDTIPVMNGTTAESKAVPNCTDTGGNHINYTAASNAFSCGTSGGGSSPFLDQQGPTGNVTMTGSDVTVFTTTIAGGTMGAGKCLTINPLWYVTSAGGISTDFKLTYGGTSHVIRSTTATAQIERVPLIRLCNNAGVTNAQTLYLPYIVYATAPPLLWDVNSGLPVTGVFTIDSTASQALAFKANGASSTVSGQQWHVEVDR